MDQIIRQAIEYRRPIQIHTGLQEGTGNVVTNSRPTHLINLFIRYPDARFDLFHAGYPYHHELAALAKNFANVYADLCWVPIISPNWPRGSPRVAGDDPGKQDTGVRRRLHDC